MATLEFSAGTLTIRGDTDGVTLPDSFTWDARSSCQRAPASAYAATLAAFADHNVELDDQALSDEPLPERAIVRREPRSYQREALSAWTRSGRRGIVVLPTGAGKSHVAVMAIDDLGRSALVVAPTLELVRQWYDLLRHTFGTEIGLLGGGEHNPRPLTISTYDSAHLHMHHLGARFGLIVFDECHHLPGPSYSMASSLSLAPHRLGLTATPERGDSPESGLSELIGPIVYRKQISDLAGDYLADYETVRLSVDLSTEERREHDEEREIYLNFLRRNGIRMGTPRGWTEFIIRSARGADGLRAMKAYRRQRELALAAPAKLDYLQHLLQVHRRDLTLIFTQDNKTAYQISRQFLLPAITHQTKVKERSEILEWFGKAKYRAIVTSKVLNEGVDVPAANVAVVMSGSGSVREHVQRLGRILRPRKGKHAILYELVSADTGETGTSLRRRQHEAYR